MDLIVDKRIETALQPLSREEFSTLESNCLAAGRVRETIKLWRDTKIIVDGHNRYKIACKHKLPFTTEELDLDSTDDVILWLLDNQFGRRNLSSAQLSMARARRAKLSPDVSRENVADSLGVTDRQLRTDVAVQRAVEEMPEALRTRVETSGLVASQKDLAKLSSLPEEKKQQVYKQLEEDKSLGLHEVIPKEDRTRHGLSKSDLEIVDRSFDSDVKRMIHVGSLKINSREIARIMALSDSKRQLVFDMLTLDEVSTVPEALELAKAPKKNNKSMDLAKASEKFEDAVGRAVAALDTYAAANGKSGSAKHTELVDKLKQIIKDAASL